MTSPMYFPNMDTAPFFKVTVFEGEHFQGHCQEFTSECCNIHNCGLDNIRSIRVESGAWVGFEHLDFQGQQFILERGEYPNWEAYSGSLAYHSERFMSFRPVYCAVSTWREERGEEERRGGGRREERGMQMTHRKRREVGVKEQDTTE
ncbi:Beta-crystallin A3 [Liparis tanakae]|uniref:Beta-crystallin A3 n=1 Tax=Liparis tanakae TaxID=230148 RepID=A0A4Z2EU34_9TELE|nr:Beta-crystallin A3 [Liparis tanakae]